MERYETNIAKLRRLTEKLPVFEGLIKSDSEIVVDPDADKRYLGVALKTAGGCIQGYGIHKEDRYAIAKWHMQKGAIIEEHVHPEANEWIMMLEGSLKLFWDDKKSDKAIGPMEYMHFPIGVPHGGEALSDVWCLTITMPADKGYPNE